MLTQVAYRLPPANWKMLGGGEVTNDEEQFISDGKNFYYQKFYDEEFIRFVDPPIECCYDDDGSTKECHSCVRTKAKEMVRWSM